MRDLKTTIIVGRKPNAKPITARCGSDEQIGQTARILQNHGYAAHVLRFETAEEAIAYRQGVC